MILELEQHLDGVVTQGGNIVVYDVMRNQAHFGAADVDGHALVWKLTGDPGPGEWLLRCDRVDFPPGGGLRSAITRCAPSAASPAAIARPMPCAPPVTIATFPSSADTTAGARTRWG